MKLQKQLEALALDFEKKAESIRTTLALLNGHLKEKATVALPQKLAAANKILKKRAPKRAERGALKDAIVELLAEHGPQTLSGLFPFAVRAGLNMDRAHLRKNLSNLLQRQHIQRKGIGRAALFSLPAEKMATSNEAGRIFSLTVPPDLTARQKRRLFGYLLYQVGKAADGPFTAADAEASFRAAKVKFNGQGLGAALRYDIIKQAPDSTSRHKTYVLGSHDAPTL